MALIDIKTENKVSNEQKVDTAPPENTGVVEEKAPKTKQENKVEENVVAEVANDPEQQDTDSNNNKNQEAIETESKEEEAKESSETDSEAVPVDTPPKKEEQEKKEANTHVKDQSTQTDNNATKTTPVDSQGK